MGTEMIARPLVSVIVIFLNPGKFLEEAIESVLAQTYDRWELLLVDDGSTDESTATALAFARRNPERVRYLEHDNHQNRGMSASRNLGIRHAGGEYISFVDADDVVLASTLAEQVAILESQPKAAMVYGPIQWWYSWTGDPSDIQRDFVERLGVQPNAVIDPPVLVPLFLLDKAAVPSGLLLRRDAVTRVGGFEDEFRGEYEDQAFLAKICLQEAVFASDRSWYRYRQHANSCVSIGLNTGRTYSARTVFLNWLKQYLHDQEITDSSVWSALSHEFSRHTHPTLFRLSRRGRYLGQKMRVWLTTISGVKSL